MNNFRKDTKNVHEELAFSTGQNITNTFDITLLAIQNSFSIVFVYVLELFIFMCF